MSQPIHDPDVMVLAALATARKQDYIDEGAVDPWLGSPFAWVRTMAPARVGKIGEQLVAGWCATKGFDVTASPNANADRIIAGQRMEIKFSTLWANGTFTFQQIRNQEHDYVICLGLAPFSAKCWVIPKPVALERSRPQHGGSAGSDTRWLRNVKPNAPPPWLAAYGGSLAAAYALLRNIAR